MKKNVIISSVILSILLLMVSTLHADSPRHPGILLSPFTIHSDKDYGFILKGVLDQLEAKLTGASVAVSRTESQSDIIKQAADKSCEYAVAGSLTFFGDTVTISASLYDVKSEKILLSYSKADVDKNHLFTRIGDFADKTIEKIQPSTPPRPDEKKLNPVETTSTPNILSADMIRTPKINTEIIAMAIGDVNGDGKKEIIYIDRHNTYIGRYENNGITLIKTIEGKKYLDNIDVSAIDVNHNGIDEIFVTSVHSKSHKVTSSIYEWNGKNIETVISESDWFFRAGKSLGTGNPVLLAQAQHFSNEIFAGPVVEMTWNASIRNYVPGQKLTLPNKYITVFGFDSGNIFNNGKMAIMSYLPGDFLGAFEINGEHSWKSSVTYGGQMKFLEPRVQETPERYYLPARILAGDFDHSGMTGIVTIVNKNSTPSFFPNLRNLTEGHLECLMWKTLNFETRWRTPDVNGYIPDFFITDLNGNHINELVYCVVEKDGNLFKKPSSFFVIQPIPNPRQ